MNWKNYLTFENVLMALIALIVLISSFVVNYADLPKGFELAKVTFLNIAAIVLIGISLIRWIYNTLEKEKLQFDKGFFVLLLMLFIYCVSSIFSDYQDISVYGNSFRNQGLIFYSLITVLAYIAYKNVDRKNHILIPAVFFISGVIQAVVGLAQYINLAQRRPELLDDGLWINGNYGQANFFSTHLVLAIIFGLYLLSLNSKRYIKKEINVLIKSAICLSLILIYIVLGLSYSIWGWVTGIFALIIYIAYKILKIKYFVITFSILSLLSILGSIVILPRLDYNLRIDIWTTSVNVFFSGISQNIFHFLFGFGFDTLGELFKDLGRFRPNIVDRGHNIFVDIFMQIGLSGFIVFTALIGFVAAKGRKLLKDNVVFFYLFSLFIFLFKTFVHEYSAIQFFYLLLLTGISLKIVQQNPNN